MERLKCKACGCYSMLPMEVAVEDDDRPAQEGEQESHFYSCHVCGDNWLSLKENDLTGGCQITFVHQMGMEPVLKRIAYMATPVLLNEHTVDTWHYFSDDEEISRSDWQEMLNKRRSVLKSVCCN